MQGPTEITFRHGRRLVGALSRHCAAGLLALWCSASVWAEDLPAPVGDVLLKIDGAISRTNVGDEAHLDRAILESLPRFSFETTSPWYEGVESFSGALIKDVLEAVGASSDSFLAAGFDDYAAEVTGLDFDRIPVLLAWERNGEPMTLRNLGPLWIMFPFDDFPDELDSHDVGAMAVWQLVTMTVHE